MVTLDWRTRLAMPVLMKEMRSRMRGNRMLLLLFITTAVSVAVGLFFLLLQWHEVVTASPNLQGSIATLGHNLFAALIVTQAVLSMLIAPALTAGSIAGEAEQQSLEMLLLSRLSGMNIAVSKLLSAVGMLLLMLVCTMPVVAVTFFMGGVSPAQILLANGLVLAIGMYGGAVGLYFSARTRKTTSAVVLAYLVVLLWCIGLPVIVYGIPMLDSSYLPGIDRNTLIYSGINLLAMLFPTLLISTIFCTCARRTMCWWVALIIWFCLSVPLCIWYALTPAAFLDGVIFMIIGNPAMAIQFQILVSPHASGASALEWWCATHLIELSLPVLLALAWAYLTFTAQRLREMRYPALRK